MCMAIDEYGKDMKIVGYIERQQEEGISLEDAIKNAAIKYGKTEKYVKEVYEEEA